LQNRGRVVGAGEVKEVLTKGVVKCYTRKEKEGADVFDNRDSLFTWIVNFVCFFIVCAILATVVVLIMKYVRYWYGKRYFGSVPFEEFVNW